MQFPSRDVIVVDRWGLNLRWYLCDWNAANIMASPITGNRLVWSIVCSGRGFHSQRPVMPNSDIITWNCFPRCWPHDDVIKWKPVSRYLPFVRWISRTKWRGALMFSLMRVWINGWVNNREAGDLRRHRAHYVVTVMFCKGRILLIFDVPFDVCHSKLWGKLLNDCWSETPRRTCDVTVTSHWMQSPTLAAKLQNDNY